MKEVFQNYEHYKNWLSVWWERDKDKDYLIIRYKLVLPVGDSCSGESYRSLTRNEFNNRSNISFVKIPTF